MNRRNFFSSIAACAVVTAARYIPGAQTSLALPIRSPNIVMSNYFTSPNAWFIKGPLEQIAMIKTFYRHCPTEYKAIYGSSS